MDVSKLALFSTENLLLMQAEIERLLKSALDTRLMTGREATFICKRGVVRKCHIIKINRTTADMKEAADSREPGKTWRVGKGGIVVKPQVKTNTPAVKRMQQPVVHTPATEADSW